jgi:hypothetical protein
MFHRRPSRRSVLLGAAAALALPSAPRPARAAAGATLGFDELYGRTTVLGLEFSDKTKSLAGQVVGMQGFMAPPLQAEARFFVLTEIPMALCPFCSTDADWPDNIVVVYLDEAQTFVQPNRPIVATGRLEVGSWRDPDTGFLSLLRLADAEFAAT